jgi:hypothetical protein
VSAIVKKKKMVLHPSSILVLLKEEEKEVCHKKKIGLFFFLNLCFFYLVYFVAPMPLPLPSSVCALFFHHQGQRRSCNGTFS